MFLSKEKRNAINNVYAFCRKTDDIVDDNSIPVEVKNEKLISWKDEFSKSLDNKSDNPILIELNKTIKEFKIPTKPFYDLMCGVEFDLNKNRYQNFDELKDYCYKVASTVGLMTIPIFGYENKQTEQFAINLGIALQLTNIIRDIKYDAELNRIYLPQDEIYNFQYSEEKILKNSYDENFVELMKYQAERAKKYYEEADKFLIGKDKASMFTAKSMEYIYLRLLDLIEQENFNVFKEKIRVSNFNKLIIAFSVFVKYQIFY